MLQGGAAARADAGSAQADADQSQARTAAAAVEQDASFPADITACGPTGDGLANEIMPVSQAADKRAGDLFISCALKAQCIAVASPEVFALCAVWHPAYAM